MTTVAVKPIPGRVKGKTTVLKALDDLDGLISIAEREQLQQGIYVSHNIDQELKNEGAICGGRQACLVGSLYLAHGVKAEKTGSKTSWYNYYKGDWERDEAGDMVYIDEYELPGVDPDNRDEFMQKRAALRLAYQYLNLAAHNYIKKNHKDEYDVLIEDFDNAWSERVEPECGWAEHLFETTLDPDNLNGMYEGNLKQKQIADHKAHIQEVIIRVAKNARYQLKQDHKEVLA